MKVISFQAFGAFGLVLCASSSDGEAVEEISFVPIEDNCGLGRRFPEKKGCTTFLEPMSDVLWPCGFGMGAI